MHQIQEVDSFTHRIVYEEFCNLPLADKLVVYSKIVHGNLFKVCKDDLFKITKKSANKTYKTFIDRIKEKTNVKKASTTKDK